MRLSWKLGQVAGIDLYVHATFLLIFLVFPGVFDGGPLSPWNVLLVLSVFGCVLLHELGHAIMARRFGIQTRDITLYPIGGVARLERMPRAPGAELLIALAGPAVNFAIAAGLLPLLILGSDASASISMIGLFLESLLTINLCLGLFNLVPAFPMDGGRVLRAFLSNWVGRLRATVIAATIGKGLAVCFGLAVLVYTQNPIHIALAAFIFLAARAEEAQVQAEERRRAYAGGNQGIWTAPPGYYWVNRGNGQWQLAPISVTFGDSNPDDRAMALTPIVELGVAEAYAILTDQFGVVGLPPLDAIENEDWGRDFLLGRLQELPAAKLAAAGLCKIEDERPDRP